MLTVETIAAAKANDLTAISSVLAETEGRVRSLADKFARRMAPHGGARFADYREEFTQIGRVAVWESLSRQTETGVDSFFAFIYRTVECTLQDAVRAERSNGADADALKVFAAMLDAAEGDVYEAEKLAQTLPPKGRRLSADRAQAARMAWQGALALDAPTNAGVRSADAEAIKWIDPPALANLLATSDELPAELRPKVGHGAVVEAVNVLARYVPAPRCEYERDALLECLELARINLHNADNVDALEELITLPRDPQVRRYVLDALRIIRSSVSTATDGELPEELCNADDSSHADSKARHERVRAVLASMGVGQRDVLVHSFGIGDGMCFGWGDSGDLEGLAAYLLVTPKMAKDRRGKARRSFAARYVAVLRTEGADAQADALAAGAAVALALGGRK